MSSILQGEPQAIQPSSKDRGTIGLGVLDTEIKWELHELKKNERIILESEMLTEQGRKERMISFTSTPEFNYLC